LSDALCQVHATQSIEILKDLPLVSGPGWKWTTRYTGVNENSTHCGHNIHVLIPDLNITAESGIVVTAENTLVDASGTPYARLYVS